MKQNYYILLLTVLTFCMFQKGYSQTYTDPSPPNAYGIYHITNLELEDINNSSNGTTGSYTYYNQSTDLNQGATYTGYVTYIAEWNEYYVKVWVDYNNDGDFEDNLEEVYSYKSTNNNTNPYTSSFTFTVPNGATIASSRMRVVVSHALPGDNNPDPEVVPTPQGVDDYRAGEYEDYNINITNPNTAPVANCQNITVNLDSGGNATITPSQINNNSIDTEDDNNSIPLNYSLNKTTFNCDDLGANTVTLTVTDSAGLTDTCTATVTVNTYSGVYQPPVLEDVEAYCEYTAIAPVMNYQCGTTITGTTSNPTYFNSAGDYVILWAFTNNGETVYSNQNVKIISPTLPTNVTYSNATTDSATISWNYSGTENYKVRYRISGTTNNWAEKTTSNKSITLTGLDDNTLYEVQVKVNQDCTVDYTSSITFETDEIVFCNPANYNNNVHYITNVTLGDIDNTTAQSDYANQYTYYDTQSTTLRAGNTYTLVLGYHVPANNEHVFKVWIDYNNDGQFSGSNEEIASYSGDQPAEAYNRTVTFTVPNNAVATSTRMRVLIARSDADPCSDKYQSGEIEDYTINIKPLATAPTASCIGSLNINLDVSGNAIITPAQINNNSFDDYDTPGDLTLSLDTTTFTCDNLGPNTVTLTVTDSDGLTDTCTTTVNISGYAGSFEAPVLNDINAYCSYTATTPIMNYSCNQEITATTSDNTTFYYPGTYTITWSFDNGESIVSSTQTVNITIPSVPTNISITNVTKTTAKIDWNSADSGPFKIRYRYNGTGSWLETTTENTNVTLSNLDNNTEYEVQVSTDASCATYSSSVTFTTVALIYCTSDVNLSNSSTYYISNVNIGDINQNTNSSVDYYTHYANTTLTIEAGGTLSGSLTYKRKADGTDTGCIIWIDYNSDGVFDNTTELIFSKTITSSSSTTVTETFSNVPIPTNAATGKSRMRVAMLQNESLPTSACDFLYSNGEIEDYDVFINPRDVADFESAMITQVYHNSTTERWIEITNNSINKISSNTIIVALYKNTSGNQTGIAPAATYTVNRALNTGQSVIIKSSNSVLGNINETPITNNDITDFNNGNDILIITSETGTIAWENRFDVISGMLDNTSYVRNDNIATYNSTYTASEWTKFVDDALNPYQVLATGGPQRHPNAPIRSEIDNANATSNIRLGVHNFGSTSRTGNAWSNGFPDKSRTVTINENYEYSSSNFTAKTLTVETGNKLTIDNNALIITNNLTLNSGAEIRLKGNSQLIQTHTNAKKVSGSGKMYVDQNSTTASVYRFNYFSSPVTNSGGTTYTVSGVMKDGTTPTSADSTPLNINFINEEDGSATTPISIAQEWIYTYASNEANVSNYVTKGAKGTIKQTDGYTFKGPGIVQNYTFVGVPNDGTLTTSVGGQETYLVGNPYPSAISVKKFIEDNINSIDGTLYFWEHVGEDETGTNGHYYGGYVGGYATRTIDLGVSADNYSANDTGADTPHVGDGLYKEPKPYITVGQGFFVSGDSNGGTITFNNSQREYITEGANSVFFRTNSQQYLSQTNTASDNEISNKPIIKLGMDFENEEKIKLHRQIGVSFDKNTTFAYEPGYDAISYNEGSTDISWKFPNDNNKYVIAGVPSINENLEVPIQLELGYTGTVTIDMDEWQNVDREVYLLDKETNTTQSLTNGKAVLNLTPQVYTDRFSLVFKEAENLSVTEQEGKSILITSDNHQINIKNQSSLIIESVELYNLVGQKLENWNVINNPQDINLATDNIPSSIYILQIKTDQGILTRKLFLK
ncbi:hypothetical protein FHR24_001040 [Wenyingzhuangia heitensis]|uniref:Fibronectin type-III domain-containing protein n=1 Tax=Wenyingzhuangia heitensis TaxID=1487859 RepID=A0ABX0UAK3_9FLAO|nr:GEVED domain-containing protein [Wenyingzhuangia heitensis]NIJ44601.1 hypothetical protein [Wenyingzhuangia heitensis]